MATKKLWDVKINIDNWHQCSVIAEDYIEAGRKGLENAVKNGIVNENRYVAEVILVRIISEGD